jgi:hypothetical protein
MRQKVPRADTWRIVMEAGPEMAMQKPMKPRNATRPMVDGPRILGDGRL